ncbi:MAG: TIGR01459 family HAD-type hydrolase [Proteobacteria bacterium]|nr:TIGR01459 family HAD-type hydrolase [Pseudomonadota bacterium]
MQFKNDIRDFVDLYDYFIFDIWGVIHDGSKVYPGAIEAISFLRQRNKKICFLSNAPRRASKVEEALNRFGITPDLYDFILSSGELTFLELQKVSGKKYFYIGPEKDIDLLSGLNHQMVADASEASFAITTGFDHEDSKVEEKMPQLLMARKNNLPLICVNPDLIVVKQDGKEQICAGVLAHEYEKLGGTVSYYGKPFPEVYKMVLQIFGVSEKTKFLAIGDGLKTDIKGAVDFGIDNVLVTNGILKDPNNEELAAVCNSLKIFPQFVIKKI